MNAVNPEERLPQPTAEGAEEILIYHNLTQPFRQILQSVALHGYDIVFAERDCVKCATDFATLHAQKIADKMVEERLREELIAFQKFETKQKWTLRAINPPEFYVDEYLKSREK